MVDLNNVFRMGHQNIIIGKVPLPTYLMYMPLVSIEVFPGIPLDFARS